MTKKTKGSAGGAMLVALLLVAGFALSFVSQQSKDLGHVNKAIDLAGKEEAKSLALLYEATNMWLDVEYNRQRLWEYDTRYEIPMDEMIENSWLPGDFASRFTEIGESVYGLTYTTSVIRRENPGFDDEFNVLTTIGDRGDYPPENPPVMCPVVYQHLDASGNSRIGGPVTLANATGFIPYDSSCTAVSAANTRTWLLTQSNWDTLNSPPSPIRPPSSNFTCNMISDPAHVLYSFAENSVNPRIIDGFVNCIFAEEPVVPPGSCPVYFTWTVDGAPVHIAGTTYWNSLHMKTYSANCTGGMASIASADIRNDNALNRSTAGIPFGASDPSCTIPGNRITCFFAETSGSNPPGGGSGDECRVYIWNELLNRYDYVNTYTDTNCYGHVP